MSKWRFLLGIGVLAGGAFAPGCSCGGPQPVSDNLKNVNPQTTGEKVACSCTLDFSAQAQSAGLPASLNTEFVESCLPANFLSSSTPELDFCNMRVAPFLQIATQEVALAVGDPPSINIVCGGPYDDMPQPLPPLVAVTCTVSDAGASSTRDPNCIDLGDAGVPFDAGDGGGGESCESIPCIVSGPGTNCPIQGPSIALDSCKCTDP